MISLRRKWLKLAFSISVIGGLFFLIGFSYKYHLPKIEAWLLLETESLSSKYSPFRVWPEDLKVSLFPLGARITNVRVMPKEEVRNTFAPAQIQEVQVQLNIFELFRGQIRIDEIKIKKPDIVVFVRDQKSEDRAKMSLRKLAEVPIDKIIVEGLKLKADIQPANLRIKSDNISFSFENRFKALLVDLAIPEIQTKFYDQAYVIKYLLESRFLIQDESLNVSAIKIKRGDTVFSGYKYGSKALEF